MNQNDPDNYNKKFYLPNKELMRIQSDSIHIYLYPYSKSDHYKVKVDPTRIIHHVGNKTLETRYSFNGNDTLLFEMNFNNKIFLKVYSRMTDSSAKKADPVILAQLDRYGFYGGALQREFEFDTLHRDLYNGFKNVDSLGFIPYQFLEFTSSDLLRVNRGEAYRLGRGYRTISFTHEGNEHEVKIFKSEGTQRLFVVPTSLCHCDSIVLPYILVTLADRIRKDMIENKWRYKPRVE